MYVNVYTTIIPRTEITDSIIQGHGAYLNLHVYMFYYRFCINIDRFQIIFLEIQYWNSTKWRRHNVESNKDILRLNSKSVFQNSCRCTLAAGQLKPDTLLTYLVLQNMALT